MCTTVNLFPWNNWKKKKNTSTFPTPEYFELFSNMFVWFLSCNWGGNFAKTCVHFRKTNTSPIVWICIHITLGRIICTTRIMYLYLVTPLHTAFEKLFNKSLNGPFPVKWSQKHLTDPQIYLHPDLFKYCFNSRTTTIITVILKQKQIHAATGFRKDLLNTTQYNIAIF